MSDGRIILGIGVGLVLASILFILFPPRKASDAQIIQRARDLGMVFKDEVKALYDK